MYYDSTLNPHIVWQKNYSLDNKFLVCSVDKIMPQINDSWIECILGVCHGDDVAFYFRTAFGGPIPPTGSDEWKTIERMCENLTTFAKTGDPNNNIIAPVRWEPASLINKDDEDKLTYKCLNIAKEVTFIDIPECDRMHLWDQIYKQSSHNII